jgi:hypothetical protein
VERVVAGLFVANSLVSAVSSIQEVHQAVRQARCREFEVLGRSRAFREFARPFARVWGHAFVELEGGKGSRQAVGHEFVDLGGSRAFRKFARSFTRV